MAKSALCESSVTNVKRRAMKEGFVARSNRLLRKQNGLARLNEKLGPLAARGREVPVEQSRRCWPSIDPMLADDRGKRTPDCVYWHFCP
jgi:hypothetical protein